MFVFFSAIPQNRVETSIFCLQNFLNHFIKQNYRITVNLLSGISFFIFFSHSFCFNFRRFLQIRRNCWWWWWCWFDFLFVISAFRPNGKRNDHINNQQHRSVHLNLFSFLTRICLQLLCLESQKSITAKENKGKERGTKRVEWRKRENRMIEEDTLHPQKSTKIRIKRRRKKTTTTNIHINPFWELQRACCGWNEYVWHIFVAAAAAAVRANMSVRVCLCSASALNGFILHLSFT